MLASETLHEIFISYRHSDTGPWAAALMRDLARGFCRDSVFLDQRDESLPIGSRWSVEIERAASHCEAMLVLMGAQWIDCKLPDGRRRLLVEDDPVRREVVLGLQCGALMLPLLFEGGRTPSVDDLPPDLLPLLEWQFNRTPINDHDWEAAFDRLVTELVKRPTLKNLHDLCTTRTGIAYLRELINTRPDVMAAVAGARAEVRRAAEQIRTLKLLKDVHDALHNIEHRCLEPMRSAPTGADLTLYELDLAEPAAQIHAAAVALGRAYPALTVLDGRLGAITRQMNQAETPVAGRILVTELEGLISKAPDAVDGLIKTAATALNIGGLADLLGTVRSVLPAHADQDPELAPLVGLTQAIDGLREHVDMLVREHGQLQALDLALRFVCRGSLDLNNQDGAPFTPGRELLHLEWEQVEIQRQALAPPYSDELMKAGFHILQHVEDRLRRAIQEGDGAAARTGFQAYFEAVGKVFWTLNSRLKAFCTELDDATNPLRAILAQLEGRHG